MRLHGNEVNSRQIRVEVSVSVLENFHNMGVRVAMQYYASLWIFAQYVSYHLVKLRMPFEGFLHTYVPITIRGYILFKVFPRDARKHLIIDERTSILCDRN